MNEYVNTTKYDVFQGDERIAQDQTIEQAAAMLELDPPEVEWAIENYGRCDTDKTIVEAGDHPSKHPGPTDPEVKNMGDDELLKAWDTATDNADQTDDWSAVARIEHELNKRKLI